MFKILLIFLLIVCTLGLGNAWVTGPTYVRLLKTSSIRMEFVFKGFKKDVDAKMLKSVENIQAQFNTIVRILQSNINNSSTLYFKV